MDFSNNYHKMVFILEGLIIAFITCQFNPLLTEGGKESTELRLNFDNKYLNKIKHIENGNIRQQKI